MLEKTSVKKPEQPAVKKAVGIAYDPGEGLPRVIVKASGEMAAQVAREFTRHQLTHRVVKNDELAGQLFRLPMEAEISPDLYQLVALLLVHVYSVEAKMKASLEND